MRRDRRNTSRLRLRRLKIKLRTQNIVVVFSNDRPEINQLARDRWKIFSIENDDLVEKAPSQSKQKPFTPIKKEESLYLKLYRCKEEEGAYLLLQ